MAFSNIKLSFFVLNLVAIFPTLLAGEPQAPCLFIFGDSIVDNGNNNHLRTAARANFLPYGIDFPAGPTGRFTNGRNIADFIAELMGFEKSIPPFANVSDQDILRGVNYGSGGAGILDETGAFFGDVISLSEQLSNHETTISRIVRLLGNESLAKQHLSSCVYYVGMGNNDYLGNYLPQLYASATQVAPNEFAARLVAQYSQHLRKLHDHGGRKVAVFEVGKLGCVPGQLATYGTSDGSQCFETTNNIVRIFNDKLSLLINDLNGRLPDAKFVAAKDISDHESYGNITILAEPCCTTDTSGACREGAVPCSNRDEYYFWDDFHPTEAANLIGANIAYGYMSPLLADPIQLM